MKRIIALLLILTFAFGFTACGSKNGVIAAIDAHDVQKARDLYREKYEKDYSAASEIYSEILDHMDKLFSNYNAGELGYDEVYTVFLTVDETGILNYSEMEERYTKLDNLKLSKETFSEAESDFESENWVDSYSKYEQVSYDDNNYSSAQARAEEAKNNYLTEMFEEADSYVSKGDLQSAYKALQNCDSRFNSDEKYLEKLKSVEGLYTDKVIEDAKAAFGENRDYEAAIRVLQSSGLTSAVITDEIKRYQGYTPVNLYELEPVRQTHSISVGDDSSSWWGHNIDVNEKSYSTDGIIYQWDERNYDETETSVVYYLNSGYSRLTGTVYRPYTTLQCDHSWNYSGSVEIYGDGVLLYSSPAITQSTYESYDIDIDITGVRELKIVVNGVWSDSDWFGVNYHPKVCLADVVLYK